MNALYFFFACFLFVALSVNASRVHYTTPYTDSQEFWTQGDRVPQNQFHTIVFALKPLGGNDALDTCDNMINLRADPKSQVYGQWLSFAEIGEIFANRQHRDTVVNWVHSMNNDEFTVREAMNAEYIAVSGQIGAIEDLINAEYYFYTDDQGRMIVRTEQFALPKAISEAVDFVGGTYKYPPRTAPGMFSHGKRLLSNAYLRSINAVSSNLTTPSLLASYYGVERTTVDNTSNSVYESLGQSFAPSDLKQFQQYFNLEETDVSQVVGPNDPSSCTKNGGENCDEASLDIQYILAMAQGANATFWSMPQSSQDPFVDWLFELANDTNPPLVHSMSYGSIAIETDAYDFDRFSLEACKLGLRGLTFCISSGDDGVANFGARGNPSQCGFHPSFPATCPYVVAVGATQGPESGQPEVACSSTTGCVITSGGGFSVVFPQPSWQNDVVPNYLKNGPKVPPTDLFNYTGRAYPDVAVIGHNYVIIVGGQAAVVDGTSCASPVFAGMISLINDARNSAGKGPVGYITPTLYSLGTGSDYSTYFNDITVGENNCCALAGSSPTCCKYGFSCTDGWDPVTGWGSPHFAAFLDYFSALP